MSTKKVDSDQLKFLAIVKRERRKQKISQEEMAGVLGVTRGSYGHKENGTTHMTVGDLVKVCRMMKIKIALVDGDNILD